MALQAQQIQGIRTQLEIRRIELMEILATRARLVRNELSQPGAEGDHIDFNHPADGAAQGDYEKDINLLQREQAELQYINEAFNRMELGIFGTCELCGGAIAFARLKAIPFTKCCIGCQRTLEDRSFMASSQNTLAT